MAPLCVMFCKFLAASQQPEARCATSASLERFRIAVQRTGGECGLCRRYVSSRPLGSRTAGAPIIPTRNRLMIRSEVRAHVAANEPVSAPGVNGPGDQATKGAAASPPAANRPQLASGRLRPPWLVRNSRNAAIALVLVILAASPFVYRYLERNFGPDPLAGIKIDAVKFDPVTGVFEVMKPAEVKPGGVKPAGAKPAMAKQIAVAKPTELAPKPVPPRSSASLATPVSEITDARAPASAHEQQTVSGACAEAVAALSLCDSGATVRDK